MTIYVFAISLFFCLVFVAIKLWERKKQTSTFVTRFLAKGDAYIFKAKAELQYALHDNKQKTIFFFLVHLPERIELFFREIKKRSHGKYHNMSERVRGKQTLRGTGDISPFMRNITRREDKK